MTPKEKAEELFNKYKEYSYTAWNGGEDEMTTEQAAIECANIAVEEIIKNCIRDISHLHYWVAVKKELSNL
jgi:hypothetical protein